MISELTWQTLCFNLSVNKASIGLGGIYYLGHVYRQTPDFKGLECWDSKKNSWISTKKTKKIG